MTFAELTLTENQVERISHFVLLVPQTVLALQSTVEIGQWQPGIDVADYQARRAEYEPLVSSMDDDATFEQWDLGKPAFTKEQVHVMIMFLEDKFTACMQDTTIDGVAWKTSDVVSIARGGV